MSTLTPIPDEPSFDAHISSLPPTALAVIYFHAPWAAPCKAMSTILSTLASTYPAATPPQIAFLSLDAEEVSEVSERYDVSQVPLVVLQRGGQTVDAITGTDAGKVRSAIESALAAAPQGKKGGAGLPPRQEVERPATQAQDAPPTPTSNPSPPAASNGANGAAPSEAEAKEALHSRLAELVSAAPVMLFMKGTPSAPQCGFSRQTVALLREKHVRYGFFNILADDEVRQGLKEYSDWPTFPQLYVGGELVGGLDIVKEEFENDPDFLQDYSVKPAAQAA